MLLNIELHAVFNNLIDVLQVNFLTGQILKYNWSKLIFLIFNGQNVKKNLRSPTKLRYQARL